MRIASPKNNGSDDNVASDNLLKLAKEHLAGEEKEHPQGRMLLDTILSIYPETRAANEAASILSKR